MLTRNIFNILVNIEEFVKKKIAVLTMTVIFRITQNILNILGFLFTNKPDQFGVVLRRFLSIIMVLSMLMPMVQ